jgi:tRNA/tmRNA/rRNA uracil-C5-methylase (TrmA/RlmC/RlmD family)
MVAGEARHTVIWQGPDGPLAMALGADTFVQTRHTGGEQLIAAVASLLPPQMDHLLDLYAGCGVMGLSLRGRCGRLTLAERAGPATADALHHLALHPDPAVEVVTGDAATLLAAMADAPLDAAVVDPPRSGCGAAVVQGLSGLSRLRTIAYVSCGLAGLERDVEAFARQGWRPQAARLVDLFADTPHVEAVVQLTRA